MKVQKYNKYLSQKLVFIVLAFSIFLLNSPTYASTAPNLGTAINYAVLAGSTVTNTGSSIVTGDLGLSPGTSITGFPPGLVTGGTIHNTDASAAQAQIDTTAAYVDLASQSCDSDLTGQDLGGLTLTAGTYCFSSSAELTGTLVLDAEGDPNAVFIFQTGTTLITSSSSSVSVINGGQNCNVFWQIGTSATLGSGTDFIGNILALASITINSGSIIKGRVLARTAAVTIHDNLITKTECNSNYDYNCSFESMDINPIHCSANGLVCVEGPFGNDQCPSDSYSINVNCDNGITLTDLNAQSYYDNLLLSIQGMQLSTTAVIGVWNFNNQVGTFASSLNLSSKDFQRELSGSCELIKVQ